MIFPIEARTRGKLVLVRHGRCEGQGRFLGGGSDPPLDAIGRDQREDLRRWFDGLAGEERPGALFTSPQRRARETAVAFTGTGLAAQTAPCLSEIHLGIWEGLSYEEIMAGWPGEGSEWFSDPFNSAPPGGEKGRDFQARAGEALKLLTGSIRDGSVILAVTHAGVIRVLLTLLLDLPFEAQRRFAIQPGGLTTVDFQDGFAVVEGINH